MILQEDPTARVFVFGSVVRGKHTGSSDIDLLVVTEKRQEPEYRLKIKVYSEMREAPLEMHVVASEEKERWYMRFIAPDEMVEVQPNAIKDNDATLYQGHFVVRLQST